MWNFFTLFLFFKYLRRCFIIKDFIINDAIRAKELRVVDNEGSPLGVISLQEAKSIADERELDLVLISPNANPPVAKIIDYGKFKFDQMKKEKEAKKKQKTVSVKGIRLSAKIDKHDAQVKANQAIKFLKAGDKVKIELRFRGRELAHKDIGQKIMADFLELIAEESKIDKPATFEGRNIIAIVSPKK